MKLIPIVMLMAAALCGCKSSSTEKAPSAPGQTKTETPMTQANNDANRQADLAGEERSGGVKYAGPAATVQIALMKSNPPQYSASVNLTSPTGGWTLQLDRGEVVGDTARVYMTLERPGDGELVTQSLVKLTKIYTSATPFKRAAVYIHLAQRGVSTLTTNYRLAATSD